MLTIIGRYGRHAHSDELREMLGLAPKAKLPREGMPARRIQGIWVHVKPLVGTSVHKRSDHRVLATCPTCYRTISAGRLHQHKCKVTT